MQKSKRRIVDSPCERAAYRGPQRASRARGLYIEQNPRAHKAISQLRRHLFFIIRSFFGTRKMRQSAPIMKAGRQAAGLGPQAKPVFA